MNKYLPMERMERTMKEGRERPRTRLRRMQRILAASPSALPSPSLNLGCRELFPSMPLRKVSFPFLPST